MTDDVYIQGQRVYREVLRPWYSTTASQDLLQDSLGQNQSSLNAQ